MKSVRVRLLTLAAALGAVASLVACHGDRSAPRPAGNTTENFSTFAREIYGANPNSTPVNFDKVTLVYDVNEDPTAFDALLM